MRSFDRSADAVRETIRSGIEQFCAFDFGLCGNRRSLPRRRIVVEGAANVVDDLLVRSVETYIAGQRYIFGSLRERIALAEIEKQPLQSNGRYGAVEIRIIFG